MQCREHVSAMLSISQETRQPDLSKKIKVTILASEWGSSKGGLSTINRELAIQLAKCPEADITFFLPQCCEKDKHAAISHNIRILEATRRPGYEELEWLSFPPEHLQIDIIIGHGVKLGRQAQVIRDAKKCNWVQVVHTDPEELGMFKNYTKPISKGEDKHNVEVELCEMANYVVGVGPKLSEAIRTYLRGCKKDQAVFDLTPGIFDEFVSVEQVPDERKHRSILVFGRGDAEDFEVKGFDIAGKAVAALPDTHLVFVGAPDGKHEEIAERLTGCGVPASRLRVRGYLKNRENLKRLFCEVDLALMPSRTEGFGLAGLEALSAGLPVLVSKNSGFGEALTKLPFGSLSVIDSEDPDVWAEAITNIWGKDRRSRLEEAEALRDSYGKKHSWAKQIKDVLEMMTNLVFAASAPRSQRSTETQRGSKEKRIGDITESYAASAPRSQRSTETQRGSKEKRTGDITESYADPVTIDSMKGKTLTFKSRGETITIHWKQGSFIGIGGDKSQNYVLCDYTTSRGKSVPVYIQRGYDIPQKLTIDSRLQYGTKDVLFFVYHDKSQTPFQERFRCRGLQKFVYTENDVLKMALDVSWAVGNYLVNV